MLVQFINPTHIVLKTSAHQETLNPTALDCRSEVNEEPLPCWWEPKGSKQGNEASLPGGFRFQSHGPKFFYMSLHQIKKTLLILLYLMAVRCQEKICFSYFLSGR